MEPLFSVNIYSEKQKLLQLCLASGRLQIFRWPFPSCTIFVTYSNEFPAIFLSLIFRIWVPQVRLFFDLKVLWIAQKVHLGGNRRWLSLFIRFKQILTVERQTCKPDRYGSSSRPPARISEENLEKYQDLKRELKRIWKCKERSPRRTLNGVNQPEEMVTGTGRGQGTRVRLQKLFPFGPARLRTQTYFRSSLLSTHFGEEKRRPEIRLCPQAREQQGSLEGYRTWDKSQQ